MNNAIYPCLGIKGKIAEAADFYVDAFGGHISQRNAIVIQLELAGQKFMLLNDGPSSSPNPAISFMVSATDEATIQQYWDKLVIGGKVMMALDKYPWSPFYGWVEDQYGVSWQLITNKENDPAQTFCPTFMFTGSNAGKAKEAIEFYTSLFPSSSVRGILNYAPEDGDNTAYIKHAQFSLNGYVAMAMDSSYAHAFNFNDAVSIVVECNTQEEIDHYWNKMTTDGGKEIACGWLSDKYGLCWQIIPSGLGKLMTDPARAQRVMKALMQMKKLIIKDLENA